MSETTTIESLQSQAANRDQHEKRLADLAFHELIAECAVRGIPSDLDRVETILSDSCKTWDDLSGEIAKLKEEHRVEALALLAPGLKQKEAELFEAHEELRKQKRESIKRAEQSIADEYDAKIRDACKLHSAASEQFNEADKAARSVAFHNEWKNKHVAIKMPGKVIGGPVNTGFNFKQGRNLSALPTRSRKDIFK